MDITHDRYMDFPILVMMIMVYCAYFKIIYYIVNHYINHYIHHCKKPIINGYEYDQKNICSSP